MTPLSLLLAAALAPGQSDAPLAWKLKKGDVFYVKTVSTSKQAMNFLGQEQTVDSDFTTHHKYEVLSADKDGMVVEQTTQKSDLKSPIPGGGDIGGKLKGLKVKLTFNAKNEVTKVEGSDKLVDAAGGDNEMVKGMMKFAFGDENLKTSANELFGFLPGKALKKGDTWKRESKASLGPLGDMKVKSEYKLAESTDKGEKITWKGDAAYTPPSGDGGGMPFTITKGDLKAEKYEGEYLFDAKTGRLVSGSATGKMTGKLTITAMGQEVELGLTMTNTSKTTVSNKSQADE